MIPSVTRALFPFALAVAAALLVKGYHQVGDGFSAGAVAALGAILQYVGREHEAAAQIVGARLAWPLFSGGLILALAVSIGPVLFGVAPVSHVPAAGDHVMHVGALALHSTILFDLGIALLVFGALVATFDELIPPFSDPRARSKNAEDADDREAHG
jgi:multisubunit Na+/H+ antiporter MnhB subunit